MTIIAAAMKDGVIAIAADTLVSGESIKCSPEYRDEPGKILQVGESYVGFCGYCATTKIMEHLIVTEPEKFNLTSRLAIFASLIRLHKILKDDYFISTSGGYDAPTEASQQNFIVVNKEGIFVADALRDVHKYSKFWAIGSGEYFGLGAMEALYDREDITAEGLVIQAATAATKFDPGCSLPLQVHTIAYDPSDAQDLSVPTRIEIKLAEKAEDKLFEDDDKDLSSEPDKGTKDE